MSITTSSFTELLLDAAHATPVDNGITIKPTFVIDNVIIVQVVAIKTKISFDFDMVDVI